MVYIHRPVTDRSLSSCTSSLQPARLCRHERARARARLYVTKQKRYAFGIGSDDTEVGSAIAHRLERPESDERYHCKRVNGTRLKGSEENDRKERGRAGEGRKEEGREERGSRVLCFLARFSSSETRNLLIFQADGIVAGRWRVHRVICPCTRTERGGGEEGNGLWSIGGK